MNISLPLNTGNFVFLSLQQTLCLKDSPHNLTKYEIKGTLKIPISLLFSEFGKIQKCSKFGKKMFSIGEKRILNPLGILHILQNF